MKIKGKEHVKWEENIKDDDDKDNDDCQIDTVEESLPVKGSKKWYDCIPIAKVKDLLPVLRHVRGAKERITFDGFKITVENNQSIFDKNHSFFSSRSQVDRVAWYMGSKLLEIIFSKYGGLKKDRLTEYLEQQEANFYVYDQLKIIKESYQKLVEKYHEGYITDKELETHEIAFMSVFKDKATADKVAKIIESQHDTEHAMREMWRRQKRGSRKRIDNIRVVGD